MISQKSKLSIEKQCELLEISKSTHYYKSNKKECKILKEKIINLYKKYPVYGYRRITKNLNEQGVLINKKKTLRLMNKFNICAIYCQPKTTISDPKAYKYPYLLRDKKVTKPHEVWQIDITYLRTPKGFVYLTALIDVFSRVVVGYSISNTLGVDSCIRALEFAIMEHGFPEIVNSDQGSQFTSEIWIQTLQKMGVKISMSGRGRSNDNAYIERLWRTLKYEWFYIYGVRFVFEYKNFLKEFIVWYNTERLHQSLGYLTPETVLKQALGACGNMEKLNNFSTVPQVQQQPQPLKYL